MSERRRLILETLCEHGEMRGHIPDPDDIRYEEDGTWWRPFCDGGSRREVNLANGQRVEAQEVEDGKTWLVIVYVPGPGTYLLTPVAEEEQDA